MGINDPIIMLYNYLFYDKILAKHSSVTLNVLLSLSSLVPLIGDTRPSVTQDCPGSVGPLL